MIHRLDPADLRRRYVAIRELTDVFASPLGPEDQTVQSMPDVSPTKWHRAHTTWFFEGHCCISGVLGCERPSVSWARLAG